MIFAFTFTGIKFFTLPLATDIALLILLRIAFLITGSSCFIASPCIAFVVRMVGGTIETGGECFSGDLGHRAVITYCWITFYIKKTTTSI